MSFSDVVSLVDDFVWGPVMLVLLVGTGIFLTIRISSVEESSICIKEYLE